ncbi:hypothetical protein F4815DRAFT_346019 [Daldinia loculata]|nr:hypothetical protein F4815DRAFT_346019 [Daldinia loculata]
MATENGTGDTANGGENRNGVDNRARRPASTPTSNASLSKRAPTEYTPKITWHVYANFPPYRVEYHTVHEQKSLCVRSWFLNPSSSIITNTYERQLSGVFSGMGGLQRKREVERMRSPYPTTFQEAVDAQRQALQGNNSRMADLPHAERNSPVRKRGYNNHWFGITRTSAIKSNIQVPPVYVVLETFPRSQAYPREVVVFIEDATQFFRRLSWATFRLRGLMRSLFSLRHVTEFRLYKCDAENGTHESIKLDSDGVADLGLLLHTYKQWRVPDYMAQAWADWVHQVLNNGSHDVLKGSYSLELVLGWSANRISVVILLPVLLSLAIGIWLNSRDWSDLATIQTAWGTASYIVTAGGITAALLGILSSIADK